MERGWKASSVTDSVRGTDRNEWSDPEVEEEPEMALELDTPPPPEPVLESGSEDWDLTLR